MRTMVLVALLAGCGGHLDDKRFATGSTTIVSSSDHGAVYTVNPDEGSVSVLRLGSGDAKPIEVGAEPTRIARAGNRVLVTLRGERSVAVLRESGGELVLERTLKVGAEPYGIVATEDGHRFYVAMSTEGKIVEFNGKTLNKIRTWDGFTHEPRWLALHPSGDSLYVASARKAHLARIDLRDPGRVVSQIKLPRMHRRGNDGKVELAMRITGDPSVTPDGRRLGVPLLYVDNKTPVDEPVFDQAPSNGYASNGDATGVSRFNPAVGIVPLNFDHGGRDDDPPTVVFVAGGVDVGGLGRDGAVETVRSYLTAAVSDPDGRVFVAPMEGSNTVALVGRLPGRFPESGGHVGSDTGVGEFTSARSGGFDTRPLRFITSSHMPRGITFVEKDRAIVHSALDRSVSDLGYERARDQLRKDAMGDFEPSEPLRANAPIHTAPQVLSEEVVAGRKLFYSAVDDRMSAPGSGVSCATCHFESRNDGLTWPFTLGEHTGLRQTPSLAGNISATAPVTWTDSVASVADEAMITSQGRMGGNQLAEADATRIQAFIDSTREVDVPAADPGSAEAGERIFHEVGCAECHVPPLYTDNKSHVMLGVKANTPSLVGIAATPPYFHTGEAATLADVIKFASLGGMGEPFTISPTEQADLEAFLQGL